MVSSYRRWTIAELFARLMDWFHRTLPLRRRAPADVSPEQAEIHEPQNLRKPAPSPVEAQQIVQPTSATILELGETSVSVAPAPATSSTSSSVVKSTTGPDDQSVDGGSGVPKRQVAPKDRGGRPRQEQASPGQEQIRNSRDLAPHMICRGGPGRWQIFVEAPMVEASCERLRALLTSFNAVDTDVVGPVPDPSMVMRARGPLGQGNSVAAREGLAVFRIIGDDTACEVVGPTQGLNMVIAPNSWRYDRKRSGAPPLEAEPLDATDYEIHYFSAQQNPIVIFDKPDGTVCAIKVAKPHFYLEGDRICDINEGAGPVFIGKLPVLKARDNAIGSVVQAIIGQEGPGRGRWKHNYSVITHAGGWQLPDDLKRRLAGWYFIRLYDQAGALVQSETFRYLPGISSIEIKPPALDEVEDRTHVKIIHDPGVHIEANGPKPDRHEHRACGDLLATSYEFICAPNAREASLEIAAGNCSASLLFDVDRILWKLQGERGASAIEPDEARWQAKPINADVQVFSPMSDAELVIRLPKRYARADAFVGFDFKSRRRLRHGPDGIARIHLNEFSDTQALWVPGTADLQLWVHSTELSETAPVIKIAILCSCRLCGKSKMTEGELLRHLISVHHDELFEQLDLHTTTEESPIPTAVYVCMECGWFCPESRLISATTLMDRHFNARHPRAQMQFTAFKNPADVRGITSRAREWVWKCKLRHGCKGIAPLPDDPNVAAQKMAHLNTNHWRELSNIS